MASLDNMQQAQKGAGDERDVELAVRMTIKLLRDGGGMKLIMDAVQQSKDPAQVIGQFLAQMVGKLAEQLRDKFQIDPSIFLAPGGWLEKVLDFIEKALDMPEEFSDQIYDSVLETIKAAAKAGDNPQPEQAPPQQGQPPTGAPPMMAGGGLGG